MHEVDLHQQVDIKKALPEIFTSLFDSFEKDRINENPALFEYLKSATIMDDLSTVELMILFPLKQLIESALKLKYEENFNGNCGDIVTNWGFYERHVSELVKMKEGFACSVDKGCFVIRKYLAWKLEKKEPVFSGGENAYWEPKIGTVYDWMDFVESLCSLRYGNPKKYLTAYSKLVTGREI